MLVAGLDLARRQDHSALVLLDVEPSRLTVGAASAAGSVARTIHADRAAPRRARPPRLRSERPRRCGGGTAAENTPHIGVCLIGGDRPLARSAQGDRLVVGKSWLIQRLGAAIGSGQLTVA